MRVALPALFAAVALAGMPVVGGIADIVGGAGFYVALVLVSALLLAAIGWSGSVRQLPTGRVGDAATAGGVLALLGFAAAPTAYSQGPGRTEWIQGAALWGAGIAIVMCLAIVAHSTRLTKTVDEARLPRARRLLFLGTASGSGTYLLLLLSVSYDLNA